MKAIFDSDVLIDYLQGLPQARGELARYERPGYSIISYMELHCGARSEREHQAVDLLLGTMQRVDLSLEIARRAVRLRNIHRLKLPDAVILATAEEEGCLLVTRNQRDFAPDDPKIRIPYLV